MDCEYLGIVFNREQMINWADDFDKVRWDDELQLVSKEVFDQGEDEGVFNHLKYRYVILGYGADYGYTYTSEEGIEVDADHYEVFLVPEIDQVADSVILSVAEIYGMEDRPVEELRKELTVCDLAEEGFGVFLGSLDCPTLTYEDEDIWGHEILNGFATAIRTIDGLRGFILDRPQNGMGQTGWDVLEGTITGKTLKDWLAR